MAPDSRGLLDILVGLPTVSRDSNFDLINFVRTFLSDRGFQVTLVPSPKEAKANLFATIGPSSSGGIILSGHTDVVPVDGQAWSSDPFRLVERNGRLYGRGTADMKGFIACAMRAADAASKTALRRPFQIALSYDEELGCLGVRDLLAHIAKGTNRPSLCIIGEPTEMRVAVGHKGKLAGRATCCGTEAHSSFAPIYLNAIHLSVDFINTIRTLQADLEADGNRDLAFDVPFTTLHVGKIAGGQSLNIVPNLCTVDFEIRNLPSDSATALFKQIEQSARRLLAPLQRRFSNADIRLDVINEYPGLDASDDSYGLALAASFAGFDSKMKVPFGTEAGLFKSALAASTVICGPGSMKQGHKPDEYVSIDQIRRCDRMMDGVIEFLVAG